MCHFASFRDPAARKNSGLVVKPRSQMHLSIPVVVQDSIERRVNINVNVIGRAVRAHTLTFPGGRLLAENIADARMGRPPQLNCPSDCNV